MAARRDSEAVGECIDSADLPSATGLEQMVHENDDGKECVLIPRDGDPETLAEQWVATDPDVLVDLTDIR